MNAAKAKPQPSSAAIEPLRILLSDAVDYAGLFPPASLEMPAAAQNFARYLQGEFRWMLGRFVVPAERLLELEKFLKPNRARGWRVTALLGRAFKDDLKSIVQFHLKAGERAHVDAVEFKIAAKDEINPILELLPHGIDAYAEVALRDDLAEQIEAIRMARLRAKIPHRRGQARRLSPAAASRAFHRRLRLCRSTVQSYRRIAPSLARCLSHDCGATRSARAHARLSECSAGCRRRQSRRHGVAASGTVGPARRLRLSRSTRTA